MNKIDKHFSLALNRASEVYFIGNGTDTDLDRAQKVIKSCALYFSSKTPQKTKLIDDEIKEELIDYVMSRAFDSSDNFVITDIERWIRGYFNLFEDPDVSEVQE